MASSIMNATLSEDNNNSTVTQATLDSPFLLFGLLTLSGLTIFGNILVITAVLKERTLHTATNYFITSLAVSDTLVGTVVMPFSAFFEAMDQKWIFGENWCDGWHSFDVLASTASILNLCVISLDRYWAIKEPMSYPAKMTGKKAAILIVIVWLCSSAISFPAIAWWRATDPNRPIPKLTCPFTEDLGFLVFSSIVSFYGPLAVMLFAYYRIYRAAAECEKSLRSGVKQSQTLSENGSENSQVVTLRIHRGGTRRNGHIDNNVKLDHRQKSPTLMVSGAPTTTHGFNLARKLAKFSKEKKAAKTLGTVMGIFIICWAPFFVSSVISGFCSDCLGSYQGIIMQIFTWLGWINSGMNPCIYAYCSKDFNRAFKRILCCSRSSSNQSSIAARIINGESSTSSTFERCNVIRIFSSKHRKKSPFKNTLIRNDGIELKKVPGGAAISATLVVENHRPLSRQTNGSAANIPPPPPPNSTCCPTKLLTVKRNSLYSIPPPDYKFDPRRSSEKLV